MSPLCAGYHGSVARKTNKELKQRRDAISDDILSDTRDAVSIAELALRHGISEESMRKDLIKLEEQGRVKRLGGGKVTKPETRAEFPVLDDIWLASRSFKNQDLKKSIASHAVVELSELLREDPKRLVFIGGGSTLAAFARLITDAPEARFITTSLEVGAILARKNIRGIELLGGEVRSDTVAVSSVETHDLEKLEGALCFLSANKLSDDGLYVSSSKEAALQRDIVRHAKGKAGTSSTPTCIVLIDESKVGDAGRGDEKSLELTDIDVLITDAPHDDALIAQVNRETAKPRVQIARPRFVIGVDIGGGGIRAATIDTYTAERVGQLHETVDVDTSSLSPSETADQVAELLKALHSAESPDRDESSLPKVPVGVALPGQLDASGELVRAAKYLRSEWEGTNPAKLFSEKAEREVYIINDADAAGLCESRFGVARDVTSRGLLLLLRSKGVGSVVYDPTKGEEGERPEGDLLLSTELGRDFYYPGAQHGFAQKVASFAAGSDEWVEEVVQFCKAIMQPENALRANGPFSFLVLSGSRATRRLEVKVAQELATMVDPPQVTRSRFGIQAPEVGAAYYASLLRGDEDVPIHGVAGG